MVALPSNVDSRMTVQTAGQSLWEPGALFPQIRAVPDFAGTSPIDLTDCRQACNLIGTIGANRSHEPDSECEYVSFICLSLPHAGTLPRYARTRLDS